MWERQTSRRTNAKSDVNASKISIRPAGNRIVSARTARIKRKSVKDRLLSDKQTYKKKRKKSEKWWIQDQYALLLEKDSSIVKCFTHHFFTPSLSFSLMHAKGSWTLDFSFNYLTFPLSQLSCLTMQKCIWSDIHCFCVLRFVSTWMMISLTWIAIIKYNIFFFPSSTKRKW